METTPKGNRMNTICTDLEAWQRAVNRQNPGRDSLDGALLLMLVFAGPKEACERLGIGEREGARRLRYLEQDGWLDGELRPTGPPGQGGSGG